MLSTNQIMEKTGLSKWSVIAHLRDGKFTRNEESVNNWVNMENKMIYQKHNLPFKTLSVGEHFVSDNSEVGYVRSQASKAGKSLNAKFSVQRISDYKAKVTRVK